MESDGVWRIAQIKPANTAKAMTTPAPVKSTGIFVRAAGQQNREHDQDRDRADINEDLDQSDKLSAEKKEKGREADKRDDETKGRVNKLRQRRGGERAGQGQNGNDEESGGAHSAKR